MVEWAVRIDWDGAMTDDLADSLAEGLQDAHGVAGTAEDGRASVRMAVEAPDAVEAVERARRLLWTGVGPDAPTPVPQRVEAQPFAEFAAAEGFAA